MYTLEDTIFKSHFLIMGPMGENRFSKINCRQTLTFIFFKLCKIKYWNMEKTNLNQLLYCYIRHKTRIFPIKFYFQVYPQ